MMRTLILIIFLIINFSVSADDLDDGIKADEPIKDDLTLDINLQYIKQKAKAAAKPFAAVYTAKLIMDIINKNEEGNRDE